MTIAPPVGVVVDTMVISWLFDDRPNPLADRYRATIGPAPVLLPFQTVMELRFGCELGGVSCGTAGSIAGSPNWPSSSPTTR